MGRRKRLRAAICEVVENQLGDNKPRETRETLNRLISPGYKEEKAKEKIGGIVVETTYETQKTFDEKKYVKALSELK